MTLSGLCDRGRGTDSSLYCCVLVMIKHAWLSLPGIFPRPLNCRKHEIILPPTICRILFVAKTLNIETGIIFWVLGTSDCSTKLVLWGQHLTTSLQDEWINELSNEWMNEWMNHNNTFGLTVNTNATPPPNSGPSSFIINCHWSILVKWRQILSSDWLMIEVLSSYWSML